MPSGNLPTMCRLATLYRSRSRNNWPTGSTTVCPPCNKPTVATGARIIAELKALRATGSLLPEGSLV